MVVNNLENVGNCEVMKSADVNKLFKSIYIKTSYRELQEHVIKLGDWAINWQIIFSVG